jgi:hypothetical protein
MIVKKNLNIQKRVEHMTNNNIKNIKEDKNHCSHCWHNTGIMLTSNPPQIEMICCHCGIRKYVRQSELIDRNKHGQFFP